MLFLTFELFVVLAMDAGKILPQTKTTAEYRIKKIEIQGLFLDYHN